MNTAIAVSIIAIIIAYLESKGIFKYGLLVSIAILTVFVGIRYEWGTDMPYYYTIFQEYANSGLSIFDLSGLSQIRDTRSAEIGWAILNLLCKPIGFFGMVILLAIVENIIIFDTIKRYVDKDYYWFAIYLYTMNPYMMALGCSMLRQWLAMCIVLFAIRFIVSGRFWLFTILIILAASFHSSTLLFIVLYLFRYFKGISVKKESITYYAIFSVIWLVIGGLFVGPVLGMLLDVDVFEAYNTYVADTKSMNGSALGFGGLLKLSLCLFCMYHARKVAKDKRMFCNILFMFIILFPMTDAVLLANRLNLYIEAVAIIALPIAMKANQQKSINVIIIGLLLVFNYYLYKGFFNSPSFHLAYCDYHTIFEVPWQ